jgi:hypothetical protein
VSPVPKAGSHSLSCPDACLSRPQGRYDPEAGPPLCPAASGAVLRPQAGVESHPRGETACGPFTSYPECRKCGSHHRHGRGQAPHPPLPSAETARSPLRFRSVIRICSRTFPTHEIVLSALLRASSTGTSFLTKQKCC